MVSNSQVNHMEKPFHPDRLPMPQPQESIVPFPSSYALLLHQENERNSPECVLILYQGKEGNSLYIASPLLRGKSVFIFVPGMSGHFFNYSESSNHSHAPLLLFIQCCDMLLLSLSHEQEMLLMDNSN